MFGGLLWGSGMSFQAGASLGHPAPKGLGIRQGMLLAELWDMN